MLLAVKPKTCAYCGKEFVPFQSMQRVCATVKCAKGFAASKRKEQKANTRARKAALKTIPDLLKAAQREFNAYIRERDKGRPCICCGVALASGSAPGGGIDAGHYRSVGSAPHLRFIEDNVHGQRKVCNRYGAGRAVDYRIGLIQRIGLEAVEKLESDNRVHRWTREELISIRDTYRAKARELKAKREA
jgi:hypothetical protein